ncbi:spc24 [[Candida] subhashii]|uniref:Kinetochore protein Spc24 n=1 Tax=[Candida] subhashii TaxID=561895 RepID=A0A8J5QLY1_9ASCO|nr:spc24 [[Candida] subhashii]KAG7665502.1 spc24 [[Candida] subhashii]
MNNKLSNLYKIDDDKYSRIKNASQLPQYQDISINRNDNIFNILEQRSLLLDKLHEGIVRQLVRLNSKSSSIKEKEVELNRTLSEITKRIEEFPDDDRNSNNRDFLNQDSILLQLKLYKALGVSISSETKEYVESGIRKQKEEVRISVMNPGDSKPSVLVVLGKDSSQEFEQLQSEPFEEPPVVTPQNPPDALLGYTTEDDQGFGKDSQEEEQPQMDLTQDVRNIESEGNGEEVKVTNTADEETNLQDNSEVEKEVDVDIIEEDQDVGVIEVLVSHSYYRVLVSHSYYLVDQDVDAEEEEDADADMSME